MLLVVKSVFNFFFEYFVNVFCFTVIFSSKTISKVSKLFEVRVFTLLMSIFCFEFLVLMNTKHENKTQNSGLGGWVSCVVLGGWLCRVVGLGVGWLGVFFSFLKVFPFL